MSTRVAFVTLAAFLTIPMVATADEVSERRAPYFEVHGANGVDALPLASTSANVSISGVIAHVKVKQVYKNEGTEPLEATYVFPGSTQSAVFAMQMQIGERTIEAKIEKKEQARKLYERAKQQGKSASLLEQHRANVFQMNVANIMPGDRIEVTLDYTELLVPTDGIYEFIYPTVVGPRFTTKGEAWAQNPHLGKGQEAKAFDWKLAASIDAGVGIEALQSPSHQIVPTFNGKSSVSLTVAPEGAADRDFVLRYRLTGKQIQTGVLAFEGDGEKFFLMMMQPPQRPAANAIPPREYIFIIDVSGSMNGFPLDVSKKMMRKLLGGLEPIDRFNIMLFAGGRTVMSDQSVPATPANIKRAINIIDRQRGGGGTQLLPALKQALKMKRDAEMSTSLVLLTDGYVTVEKEAFDLVRQNLGRANLFAFGIGRSVNRLLIEGLARTGMGEPFVVLDKKQAGAQAEKFRKYIASPVLTNVAVSYEGLDAYDLEPSTLPDLFAQRPIIVFGKYRGGLRGRIAVEGTNGLGRFNRSIDLGNVSAKPRNQALRQLWARHRIQQLSDVGKLQRNGPSLKTEITALGLRYSLMTEHTSFVAVDSEVRNHSGDSTTVAQPSLPPAGVNMKMATGAPTRRLSARTRRSKPSPRRGNRGGRSSRGGGRFGVMGGDSGGFGSVGGSAGPAPVTASPAPSADPAPEPADDASVDEAEADAPAKAAEESRKDDRKERLRLLIKSTKRISKARARRMIDTYSIRRALGRCSDLPARKINVVLRFDTNGQARLERIEGHGMNVCVARAFASLRLKALANEKIRIEIRRR